MAAPVTFTTRDGGVSDGAYAELNLGRHVGDAEASVAQNRRRLAARLGVERVVFMRQVHGRAVAVVDDGTQDDVGGVDALVSVSPGVALGVLVADCVPILVVGARGAAAVHAGRRGVHADVVGAATFVAQTDQAFGGLRRRVAADNVGDIFVRYQSVQAIATQHDHVGRT